MPTYDYRCDACGHEFELFQSMTDAVKRKCPKCGKPKLKRLVGTGAGIIFKGSGFYETDYRSEAYTKAAEAEKKASSEGGDKGDKGDKKAAASDAPAKKSEASAKSSSSSAKTSGTKKKSKKG